jgi:hypothetical protein
MLPARAACILATGPSLTPEVIAAARRGRALGAWALFGINHVYRDVPELDTFLACNVQYYETQWARGLREHRAEKWIAVDEKQPERFRAAMKFGLNVIAGEWGDGFSKDPCRLHYGHSSGFQVPQLAVHAGFRRLLLCGYDMRYAADYDGRNQRIGSSPRHYFGNGEYEDAALNHWPSVKVKHGVHIELIEQFEKVKRLNTDLEIINCSPGSAMACFPMSTLEEQLDLWATSSAIRKSFASAG